MKPWTLSDKFGNTHKDSPTGFGGHDTYTCKRCGYTFDLHDSGTWPSDMPSPGEIAERHMLEHIAMFHRDEIMGESRRGMSPMDETGALLPTGIAAGDDGRVWHSPPQEGDGIRHKMEADRG